MIVTFNETYEQTETEDISRDAQKQTKVRMNEGRVTQIKNGSTAPEGVMFRGWG